VARQLSFSARARSRAPRPEVFRLLADSSTWSSWTPFTTVTVVEQAPGGGEGVGSVKETRLRGLTGREKIVALTPDRQFSYAYVKGAFAPYIRDYVAIVDLDDDGDGTAIHWHSTYRSRFPGSGPLIRRTLRSFVQRCADGLAAAATVR
jgi:Polyketide cyclase / dehydrase and lipid transport